VKPARIVDEELLAFVRTIPCLACGVTPSHAHHVTTKGAGGGDTVSNLMPLCWKHHSEWHLSFVKFIPKYPVVRSWLELAERWDILEKVNRLTLQKEIGADPESPEPAPTEDSE
jgi:hypothetical protein